MKGSERKLINCKRCSLSFKSKSSIKDHLHDHHMKKNSDYLFLELEVDYELVNKGIYNIDERNK